jgi:hypothetical protein
MGQSTGKGREQYSGNDWQDPTAIECIANLDFEQERTEGTETVKKEIAFLCFLCFLLFQDSTA